MIIRWSLTKEAKIAIRGWTRGLITQRARDSINHPVQTLSPTGNSEELKPQQTKKQRQVCE